MISIFMKSVVKVSNIADASLHIPICLKLVEVKNLEGKVQNPVLLTYVPNSNKHKDFYLLIRNTF